MGHRRTMQLSTCPKRLPREGFECMLRNGRVQTRMRHHALSPSRKNWNERHASAQGFEHLNFCEVAHPAGTISGGGSCGSDRDVRKSRLQSVQDEIRLTKYTNFGAIYSA